MDRRNTVRIWFRFWLRARSQPQAERQMFRRGGRTRRPVDPMNRRTICCILAAMPIAAVMAAVGQSPRVLRIAWVSPERAGSTSPNLTAFRAGMRELGYVEGKSFVIDTRWGEGSSERIEQMAGDIVRAGPDVIVT